MSVALHCQLIVNAAAANSIAAAVAKRSPFYRDKAKKKEISKKKKRVGCAVELLSVAVHVCGSSFGTTRRLLLIKSRQRVTVVVVVVVVIRAHFVILFIPLDYN